MNMVNNDDKTVFCYFSVWGVKLYHSALYGGNTEVKLILIVSIY